MPIDSEATARIARPWYRIFAAFFVEAARRLRRLRSGPAIPPRARAAPPLAIPPAPLPLGAASGRGTDTLVSPGVYAVEEIMGALWGLSPEHLDVVAQLLDHVRVVRALGPEALAEAYVLYVLARLHPDADGTVPVSRIMDKLVFLPRVAVDGALARLAAGGRITLRVDSGGQRCCLNPDPAAASGHTGDTRGAVTSDR